MRVLWMAAELRLDYAHVPWEYDDPRLKEPDFLKLNTAGAIPIIVDDGFALSESLAINLYLAKKYGAAQPEPLFLSSPEDEASTLHWSLWAQGHLEPWLQKDKLLADVIDAVGHRADRIVEHSLGVLDRALTGRRWRLSDHFTVCDLNVAGVLSPSRSEGLNLSDHADVAGWLTRCYARPAAVETRRRFYG